MSLETMTKIGTYTVGAGTDSSVSFTNIPQTYTDLIVKVSGHLTGTGFGAATIKLIFNSSTSGYSWRSVLTDSAGGSYSQKGDSVAFIEAGILPASQSSPTLNVFGVADMLISNYSSNNSRAVSIDYAQESGGVDNYIGFVSGIWSNTAPVTSLTITPNSSNFSQYSTFTLYGVKSMRAASGNSIKATGGSVNFDGTYVTHTFNSTGSFTPTTNLRVDYLVVAGGGGAGGYISGGGGAGGLRSTVTATGGGGTLETALSLTSGTAYTVTIGAGGAGGTGNANGTAGSNSVFSTITSTGGGYGGYFPTSSGAGTVGGTGGSGGGAGARSSTGGAGTANQGYAGGNTDGNNVGGGGGGAGAVGQGTGNAGNGGAGIATSITGSSVTYAGGGGAGSSSPTVSATGGSGGGGNGNTSDAGNGSNGTANTGGGGGGGGYTSGSGIGGTGGSGVVIVRYKG